MIYPIYLLDDQRETRAACSTLLQQHGWKVHPFASAADFLAALAELAPGVVMMNLRGDAQGDLIVPDELRQRGIRWPLFVVAQDIDVSMAVRAMKLGAWDVIERPVELAALLDALDEALQKFVSDSGSADRTGRARALIAALPPRELQVLRALLAGYTNKHVAELCGVSVRTVELYRSHILERLGVGTMVGAVRIALEAGVQPWDREAA